MLFASTGYRVFGVLHTQFMVPLMSFFTVIDCAVHRGPFRSVIFKLCNLQKINICYSSFWESASVDAVSNDSEAHGGTSKKLIRYTT